MNLDRLKALIRLANNNPSENEANTAARRVCQELAKNNFSFFYTPRTAADKINQHARNYGGNVNSSDIFQDMWDMMRKAREQQAKQKPPEPAKTWNDVKRSEEPQFRSSPPNPEYWKGGFRPSQAQEDFFRNIKYTRSWVDDYPFEDPGPDHQYDANGKRIKKSAKRKCTKCGLEVDTYRLKENPFVCNPCHWKEKL